MLSEIIQEIKKYCPNSNFSPIEKAYHFAEKAHSKQLRASGEKYFLHCINVAQILIGLKLDVPTIVAALLHDVLEDTDVTIENLKNEFDKEIVSLVEGVTKIGSYKFKDPEIAQAENWRKMLLAVTKDIRVILVKLADRLHNLRTIQFLPQDKQKSIANESITLYAPFAQRLGIYKWKSEIEDLSFAVIHPEEHKIMMDAWTKRKETDIKNIELWEKLIKEKLANTGIPYRFSSRPKNIYGVYRKMRRKNIDFSQIQDLIGIRLITDTVENCYALLGIMHTAFLPVPGSFTDYINMPKVNMYQSLHTSILGPEDLLAEIQIRTEDMHKRCEYGIASHWRYKEKKVHDKNYKPEEIDEKLDWLKEVLEWQKELKDSKEFLNAFKTECKFEQVFVFTPKGKLTKLPADATPVDFAYVVHSDIGNHCYGAKIGKKLVPLDYKLKSGDMCEILTRKNTKPSKHWLGFVITANARSKIRRFLRKENAK
ncbi:RelA/SpoT family protein [Elusimicrobiota bacterium]